MDILKLSLDIPPSVNHCYKNVMVRGHKSRALTPQAEAWKHYTMYVAKLAVRKQGWQIVPKEKVVVELYAFWPNMHIRDMNNMHKLLPDALEGFVYDNDRYALIRDMDFVVDKEKPRVECVIYLKKDENQVLLERLIKAGVLNREQG